MGLLACLVWQVRPKPPVLVLRERTPYDFTVTWKQPELVDSTGDGELNDITHYEILNSQFGSVETIALNDMSYTVSDRERGATYTFKVRAVTSLGAGAFSDELTVASVTSLYPGAPRDLTVTAVSARSFVDMRPKSLL